MDSSSTNDPRAVYDATAASYAATIGTQLNPTYEGPVDRAQLDSFAALAASAGLPVADLGCGPGRVATFLRDRGIPTVGVDLSPAMLAVGRAAHHGLPFAAGELAHLPMRSGTLGGAVSWYSVIHTAAADLVAVFDEVARMLTAGAPLLVAFQTADDERVDRPDAHGSGHPLTSFRHSVGTVTDAVEAGGFAVVDTTVRPPMSEAEPTAQGYVLAQRRTR